MGDRKLNSFEDIDKSKELAYSLLNKFNLEKYKKRHPL
jgi:hypothetical protein